MPTLKYTVLRAVLISVPVLLVFNLFVGESEERTDNILRVMRNIPSDIKNRTLNVLSDAHNVLTTHNFLYRTSELEESVKVSSLSQKSLEELENNISSLDDNELLDEKKFQSKSDGSSQKRTEENSTFLDEDMSLDAEKINSTSEDEEDEINLDPKEEAVFGFEDVTMDGISSHIQFTEQELNESQNSRIQHLQTVCNKYKDVYRPEYSALYSSEYTANPCTKTFFEVDQVNYTVCTILKGGLNSWKAFFRDNHINYTYKAYCPDCEKWSSVRILQIRHPLERLLSAWRHVFEDEGWRSLDVNSILYPEIRDRLEEKYKKVNWTVFVEYVLLKNTLKRDYDLNFIHDIGAGNNWVLNHWAPIWFTCGVCQPINFPNYIIQMETSGRDQSGLLYRMNLPDTAMFPKVKVTGKAENDPHHSASVVKTYFSQLTKQQVRDLYELYRLDHELFDYSPQKYIDLAT